MGLKQLHEGVEGVGKGGKLGALNNLANKKLDPL